jgi:hypothetical protein
MRSTLLLLLLLVGQPGRAADPGSASDRSGPDHVSGVVLVHFAPESLLPAVGDARMAAGQLATFVPEPVIAKMRAALGAEPRAWGLTRVFSDLTPVTATSTSRLGDTVPVPPFWAVFRLAVPPGSEAEIADRLDRMTPEIWYAQVDHLFRFQGVPDDPSYAQNQASLHPTTAFPGAHVDVEHPWCCWETGEPEIRVGVYDSGIEQTHEDLAGVVQGGRDFVHDTPLAAPFDPFGHGTACAGIIGAIRNNAVAIAGIAGGDDDLDKPGVSLFDMRIGVDAPAAESILAAAIVQGAQPTSSGGFGLHIMSNSWGGPDYGPVLRDAIAFATANDVTFVAARGNDGNSEADFPACFADELVINVTASSIDGEFQNAQPGSDDYTSSFDHGVDLMAPGTSQIVTSLLNAEEGVVPFYGTSAAAPHVAAAAALLQSRFGASLAPEDVEQILQRSATDKLVVPGSSNAVGYDIYGGWGLLNIAQAFRILDPAKYSLHHFGTFDNATTSIVPTLVTSSAVVVLPENYQGIAAGTYLVEVWKATHTLSYEIPANETIVASWVRHSGSFGWGQANPISVVPNFARIVSVTHSQAVLETFTYHFVAVLPTFQQMDVWKPATQPITTRVALTVYTNDESVWEPTQAPLAIYRFEGPDRGLDSSGFGHHGVANAQVVPAGPGPFDGSALRFDPTNGVEEFSAPVGPALNLLGPMTGMAWIRPLGSHTPDDDPAGCLEGTIFSKGGNYWFQVLQDNQGLLLQNEGSGSDLAVSSVPIPENTWTHVAFVRSPDAHTVRFFVNGVFAGEDELTQLPSWSTAPLSVGNYGFNGPGDCEFNGDIDSIRIYERCLTDAEVTAIYALGGSGFGVVPALTGPAAAGTALLLAALASVVLWRHRPT